MTRVLSPQPRVAGFLAAMVFLAIIGAAVAQPSTTEVTPGKARQFLELLNDAEVKTWLESKSAQPELAAPASTFADAAASWEATVRSRIDALLAAIPRLPAESAKVAETAARDVNSGKPGTVLLILTALVGAGLGAEWLVRHPTGRVTADRAKVDATRFAVEISALLAFSLASFGSFVAFDWPPQLHKAVLTLLAAIIAFRLVRAIAGLILSLPSADSDPEDHMPAEPDPAVIGFWVRRTNLIAGIVLCPASALMGPNRLN